MGQKKGIPLYVERVLQNYTDSHHPLNATQISGKIMEAFNLEPDRRSIYDAIDLLNTLTPECISNEPEEGKGYFWNERLFSFQEASLLVNAVSSFPFLTEKKVKELILKIKSTQNMETAAKLANLGYIKSQNQTSNTHVPLVLCDLDEAIREGKKVSFNYLHYDEHKNLVPRRPEPYIRCPYGMVFTNEHYYLACASQSHPDLSLYRVDRMKNLRILDEKIDTRIDKKTIREQTEYSVFAMSGKPERITLIVSAPILDAVIDRFGKNITYFKEDETHYRVELYASPKGMKYWALQFLDSVEVIAPQDLRDEIAESVKKCAYLK